MRLSDVISIYARFAPESVQCEFECESRHWVVLPSHRKSKECDGYGASLPYWKRDTWINQNLNAQ